MMKKKNLFQNIFLSGSLILALSLLFVVVGCESETTNTGLTVDPSFTDFVYGSHEGGVFTVTGLPDGANTNTAVYMPLIWSVDTPALGTIKTSGGNSASYESFGIVGVNTITVRDQAGREGLAIAKVPYPGTPEPSPTASPTPNLSITPSSVTIASGRSTVLTATGYSGMPLTWSVSDPQLGYITPNSASDKAVYQSKGSLGNNVIRVRDSAGREAVSVIEVAAP